MRIEALPEEERTPYWRNSYHSGRMVIIAERLLEKAQEAGLLPGRKVAAVVGHNFCGGAPDDFSMRDFGPTEHIYTVELDDGSIVKLGDNSYPALLGVVREGSN